MRDPACGRRLTRSHEQASACAIPHAGGDSCDPMSRLRHARPYAGTLATLPAADTTLPSDGDNATTRWMSSFPAVDITLPSDGDNATTRWMSSFPAWISCFPAWISSFPAWISSFPAWISSFPAWISSFPAVDGGMTRHLAAARGARKTAASARTQRHPRPCSPQSSAGVLGAATRTDET